MKVSWLKYEKDENSFKRPEALGFDVIKLNDPEYLANFARENAGMGCFLCRRKIQGALV